MYIAHSCQITSQSPCIKKSAIDMKPTKYGQKTHLVTQAGFVSQIISDQPRRKIPWSIQIGCAVSRWKGLPVDIVPSRVYRVALRSRTLLQCLAYKQTTFCLHTYLNTRHAKNVNRKLYHFYNGKHNFIIDCTSAASWWCLTVYEFSAKQTFLCIYK